MFVLLKLFFFFVLRVRLEENSQCCIQPCVEICSKESTPLIDPSCQAPTYEPYLPLADKQYNDATKDIFLKMMNVLRKI